MPAKLNLIGQRFGKLVVIKESLERKNNLVSWECQCDCGEKIIATTKQLRKGQTTSCGCTRIKDLTGQKFGKLTAIKPTKERSHGSVIWECQCECGNITYASAEGLRAGDNRSCGCYNSSRIKFAERVKKDLTGQRFGKLVVIKDSGLKNTINHVLWECQCDCGNKILVTTNHLTTQNTQSCGCLISQSVGEIKIKKILDENNIKYKSEYIFSELPNRRYDFALLDENDNVIQLIEFDGEQHFIETKFFKKTLKEQQEIDNEKTIFAKNKGIKLVRIPYWKRKNLCFKDLEVDI